MRMEKIQEYIVKPTISIKESLKKMDSLRAKLLIVMDVNNKYVGLLSIGDIQRSILAGKSLDNIIGDILRSDYIVAKPTDSKEYIKKIMITIRAEFMPIVNNSGDLVGIFFWDELFEKSEAIPVKQFNLPIVVMAGGFGSRVKPLTNVLPKPLLPLGETTMLEEIFSRFNRHGCSQFLLSVNYKAELIEFYLKQQNLPYQLDFFKEAEPLGTAGSLHLLRDKLQSTFFVSNCDILIDQDYSEILNYHYANNNEITIVSAIKTYDIPYGTLTTTVNGNLQSLSEKPALTFQINSGMYVLEPSVLSDIPEDSFFHITQLIESLLSDKRKVGVFPVSEGSWVDMGTLEQYIYLISK